MTDLNLVEIAAKVRDNAYAPYSGYQVGAALLCKSGEVITGCNVENVSFGATICAERTAFSKAITDGKTDFDKIAISVTGDEIGMPCGVCRQVMSEFVNNDFKVICANNKNKFEVYDFPQLLPSAFNSTSVNRKE